MIKCARLPGHGNQIKMIVKNQGSYRSITQILSQISAIETAKEVPSYRSYYK